MIDCDREINLERYGDLTLNKTDTEMDDMISPEEALYLNMNGLSKVALETAKEYGLNTKMAK